MMAMDVIPGDSFGNGNTREDANPIDTDSPRVGRSSKYQYPPHHLQPALLQLFFVAGVMYGEFTRLQY